MCIDDLDIFDTQPLLLLDTGREVSEMLFGRGKKNITLRIVSAVDFPVSEKLKRVKREQDVYVRLELRSDPPGRLAGGPPSLPAFRFKDANVPRTAFRQVVRDTRTDHAGADDHDRSIPGFHFLVFSLLEIFLGQDKLKNEK
jgi:hypothetical protein